MEPYNFSGETKTWLSGWLSGGKELKDLPSQIVSETYNYINHDNDQQIVLYKALTPGDVLNTEAMLIAFQSPSSWTYTLEVAEKFRGTDLPIVIARFGCSSILIDTLELDFGYVARQLGGYPKEHEVIILPGTYRVKIVPEKE
jgi:hypothetical protein